MVSAVSNGLLVFPIVWSDQSYWIDRIVWIIEAVTAFPRIDFILNGYLEVLNLAEALAGKIRHANPYTFSITTLASAHSAQKRIFTRTWALIALSRVKYVIPSSSGIEWSSFGSKLGTL